MENTKKSSRFSEAEYGLMKSMFKDNDDTLMLIRKIFFFGGLNEDEIQQAKALFSREEVFSMLRRTFSPSIEETDPITQVTDTWMTLDLKEAMPGEIGIRIRAREKTNRLMSEALERLKNPSSEKIGVLSYSPEENDEDESHVSLLARNTFINGTIIQLANLRVMANKDEESDEEKQKRSLKNSSK